MLHGTSQMEKFNILSAEYADPYYLFTPTDDYLYAVKIDTRNLVEDIFEENGDYQFLTHEGVWVLSKK